MSCRLKLSVVQLVLCTLIAIFVEKMKLVGFRHAKTDQQCPVPPKRTFGDVYMTIYMIHFRMLVWCSSSTDHVHLHCNIKVKHKGITTNFINNTGVRNCLSSPWERGGGEGSLITFRVILIDDMTNFQKESWVPIKMHVSDTHCANWVSFSLQNFRRLLLLI